MIAAVFTYSLLAACVAGLGCLLRPQWVNRDEQRLVDSWLVDMGEGIKRTGGAR